MANVNFLRQSRTSESGVVQLVELDNGVVQITMKDEKSRNTFSPELISGLSECFDAVAKNNSYKVVVLTGYGNYFASGGTKEELIRIHRQEIKFNDLDFFKIALDCQLPVIAAMQGHGIGGGFILGLYADLVVLSQESIYTTNFMKYGFTPGLGATLIVPTKLGSVLGHEMMYTAQNYRGEELAKRGIAFPVLPRKEVLNYALNLAQKIAEKPRLSLITLKEKLTAKTRNKLPKSIDEEVAMHEITFHQPEVANLIDLNFGAVNHGKISNDNHQQINPQENILSLLQLGDLSLDRAEAILLGINRAETQVKTVKENDATDILSQLQSGDISLDRAEAILLGINRAETQVKTVKENDATDILSQLQSGDISLDRAEAILLGINRAETQAKTVKENDAADILSQLQSEDISLDRAEKILLEVADADRVDEIPKSTSVQNTDIAIIGMSCRYPGANNCQELWENLKNGVDSVTEIPPGRWEGKNWYHPDPEHPDTSYSKWGGFLEGVDKFDPFFFQIAPAEAKFIEPQQRIFLEVAYHAIEDAGYAADSLKGKKCGVFVGAANGDYSKLLSMSGLETNRQVMTGTSLSVLPARIAYYLDLRGPAMAIETACSSSLVAIHQACESIQRGETELAIAGGVALMLTPMQNIITSQFQMVSPQGRCRTFDASASGVVWGEGCGVILLKRYDRAVQDNDRIYGVVKGSGINYDGNTNGITAPSSQSQVELETMVYDKFGINPETIGYVEAHGTATSLGDPIEIDALTEAFSQYTNNQQFCAIGSLKTNIGHTAWAAGVASVIKAVLCLKHQKLVPSLHFKQSNPHIEFENTPFYVNTEFKDWEAIAGIPRRAAVSSFGFSGTNAHLVLEEAASPGNRQQATGNSDKQHYQATGNRQQATVTRSVTNRRGDTDLMGASRTDAPVETHHAPRPRVPASPRHLIEPPLHLLTLSAKTATALDQLVSNYYNYLATHPELKLADVCYTANTGRAHFNHRLVVIGSNQQQLQDKLLQYKLGEEVAGICSGELPNNKTTPKIAFLFTGQGSQYLNMGRQLYQQAPVFRQALDQCDSILSAELEHSLLEVIYPAAGNSSQNLLDQTAYTQPALFAVEYALFQLWRSWGIKPDAVMGHSVGEYVAATVAGVFSLEDGLKLISARGRLMQQLPSGGEMVAVMASKSKVEQLIGPYAEKVAIAAINGPETVVISGVAETIKDIVSKLEIEGVKTKQLQVSHAFHSPLMTPMLSEFAHIASQLTYHLPQIPLVSNVTGKMIDDRITNVQYWVNHIRQPVRFAESIQTLHGKGYQVFLEIGPKPILVGMGRQCLSENLAVWLPSLRPGVVEWQQILSSLANLYVRGFKVDWSALYRYDLPQKVRLPTYPFQRQRYWVDTIAHQQQTGINFPENISVPLINLLHQGETKKLAEKLEKTGKLSPEQLKNLPNFLEILVAQYQQEIVTDKQQKSPPINSNPEILDKLQGASRKERLEILKSYIKSQVALLIGLDSSQLPDTNQGFAEMGMDSLMAIELKKKLETTLLINLSSTLAFNYPNIAALSRYILEDVMGLNQQETKVETWQNINYKNNKNTDDLLAYISELEKLSEDELEASLAKEIAEFRNLTRGIND